MNQELRDVTLEGYKVYGEGATAIVYVSEKDPTLILKVFHEGATFENVKAEYESSVNAEKLGIHIPPALEFVTVNKKQYAISYRKLMNKVSFSKAIHNNPDKLEEYIRLFAKECKKFHTIEANGVSLPSRKDHLLGCTDRFPELNEDEKNVLRYFIKSIPDSNIISHGDMHTGNAVLADGGVYWIDLGALATGDSRFDIGILAFFFTVMCENPMMQEIFHLTPDQMRKCWFYFAKEYFGNEDDTFPAMKAKELAPFGISLILPSYENGVPLSSCLNAIRALIGLIKSI